MLFNKMSIRSKIVLLISVSIVISILFSVVTIRSIETLSRDTKSILAKESRIAEYSAHGRANVRGMRQYEKDIFLNISSREKVEEYYKKWKKEYSSGLEKLELILPLVNDRSDLTILNEMIANMKKYNKGFHTIYTMVLAGKIVTAESGNQEIAKYKKPIRDLADQSKDFAYKYTEIMHSMNTRIDTVTKATYTQLLIIFIVVTFIFIITALSIYRSIIIPLKSIITNTKELANGDGDLTRRIDIKTKDELGELGNSLNEFIANTNNLIKDIKGGMQSLTLAITEISDGNNNLSQRTSEQASSLEEIASTIEEASATITQTAENSVIAQDTTYELSNIGKDGSQVVQDAINAIQDLANSSNKISEISSMIKEIAFQTNLLALNAAVEAARAGEQGRGFAVVAGEVRNLAQRAGSSAKEISLLIADSMQKVSRGTELSVNSGKAIEKIMNSLNAVNSIITEISASSSEQKMGMQQINSAISELDKMTQQNASLVEQIASSSEEMSSQAEEVQSLIGSFKTD